MIDYRVYLVTDDPSRYAGDWLECVAAAVAGGVTCVQYRDTESTPSERFARARRLRDLLGPRGIPLIVNNDAELAVAVGAAGVHVGQGDLQPSQVRAIVGPGCEIGYSITAIDQLASRRAEIACCDCLGVGPVFDATRTKADAARAMGVDGLRAIVKAMPGRPIVAIGGITCANAAQVTATDVAGLAVVSAFSRAKDPKAVAAELRRLFK